MTTSPTRPQVAVPASRWSRARAADRLGELGRAGWEGRARWAGPVAVAVAVATAYIVFAAWQWSQYTVKSWDLGIFSELLKAYSRLQPPIVNIKGDGYNLLGDHFHPLLAIIAPVYALAPHPFTLLVVQALCFAIAAAVITRTATRRLGTPTGVLLGLAFGLSWGLQHAADAQFHEIALAVPLLAWSLSAMLERRDLAAALWAAPLVFVKEDLGLTVVVIGLLLAYRSRTPLGLWLAVWGAAWFAIAVFVVLPSLNPDGAWAYAGKADPAGVFADPAALFHPQKGVTISLLLVITAGLLLISPFSLILLPTLAWRFLSTNEGYWAPTWHYSAVLIPIAFVALIDGIDRAGASRWAWLRTYSRNAPAIAVTAAAVLLPTLPLWSMLAPGAWTPPARAASAEIALGLIPAHATVETDIGLMSYAVADHDVFWLGNPNPAPDCLLIDRVAGTPQDWGDVSEIARRLHPETAYDVIAQLDGIELACRPGVATAS